MLFTTYLLPAEVLMFPDTKCLQPKHIAVELVSGYHGCSVAQTSRRIGGWAMELVTNHEYLRSSAIVMLSQFLMQASCSRGRVFDCKRASVHCAYVRIFVGLASASVGCIGRGLCSRCQGGRELVSEVGGVSERTSFKRSFRSIGARSHALRFIAPDADLEISCSGENEVSLSQKRGLRELPGSVATASVFF